MIVGGVLVIALGYFVKYSSIGNQMRATSQNNQAAMIVGVNINKIYTITFIFGASLSAIAGSLVGAMLVTEPSMGMHVIVKAFVVVIVGGMGSIVGSIIAGLGLGLIETFAGFLMPTEYIDIVGFSIMILVLLIKPSGIMGEKGRRSDA
jgi:branched-chain amino acid transport system permease protein